MVFLLSSRFKGSVPICGGFLLFKKVISDITLMHYSNCFIDIEPLNP